MKRETMKITVDSELKIFIKKYAKDQHTSVSKVLESYIEELQKAVVTYIPESSELKEIMNIMDLDIKGMISKDLIGDSLTEKYVDK